MNISKLTIHNITFEMFLGSQKQYCFNAIKNQCILIHDYWNNKLKMYMKDISVFFLEEFTF